MKITKAEVNPRRAKRGRQGRQPNLGRIYWWFKSETVLDHLVNRRNEPYNVIRPLVKQWLTENGHNFTKLRFSQYAGCTCPCSPGFIVEGCLFYKDVHLTLEFEPEDAAIEETQVEVLKPGI
jgi:hypothetical protein